MTQSLTERLQERLATQSAEIERLTATELARLGERLQAESQAALASMRSAIHESIESTRRPLARDLDRIRGIGRWWWGTLAITWLALAMLTGFSLWLWTSGGMGSGMGMGTARLSGMGVDPVFTAEGRTYLLLPEGTQAMRCWQGERPSVPCVALPATGTGSGMGTGPALAGGTSEEPGGTLTAPVVRPPARPSGRPDGS